MNRTGRCPTRIAWSVVLLLGAVSSGPARALESDQYYAWGRDLADATDVLNAKVRLEIDLALEEINSKKSWQRMDCHKVVKRVVPRFTEFIFQDIELWATNSALVPRIPATPEEELEFREKYIYRNTHALDVGTKVPPSPTIEINGVRMGTDKLSHFFSEGWWYYKWYRKYRKSGLSVEDAEHRVIRRGIWWERTILGLIASGVFSVGDLEANFQGLRFMASMCDADSPALRKTDDGWRYTATFDFRNYVTPEWDESYQPPVFGKSRWNKVRPAVIEYCPMLHDPLVTLRRREYGRRDTVTATELEVQKLVDAGKLADPRKFSLESNCDRTPRTVLADRAGSGERVVAPR
jgi:hypothetical protein